MSDPIVSRTLGGTTFAIVLETVESDASGQPPTQQARYFVAKDRVTREVYLDALATMTAQLTKTS